MIGAATSEVPEFLPMTSGMQIRLHFVWQLTVFSYYAQSRVEMVAMRECI